jgi:hypothetical protein
MTKLYVVDVRNSVEEILDFYEIPEEFVNTALGYAKRVHPDALGVMTEFNLGLLFGMHRMLDPEGEGQLGVVIVPDNVFLQVVSLINKDYATATKSMKVYSLVSRLTRLIVHYGFDTTSVPDLVQGPITEE